MTGLATLAWQTVAAGLAILLVGALIGGCHGSTKSERRQVDRQQKVCLQTGQCDSVKLK